MDDRANFPGDARRSVVETFRLSARGRKRSRHVPDHRLSQHQHKSGPAPPRSKKPNAFSTTTTAQSSPSDGRSVDRCRHSRTVRRKSARPRERRRKVDSRSESPRGINAAISIAWLRKSSRSCAADSCDLPDDELARDVVESRLAMPAAHKFLASSSLRLAAASARLRDRCA